MASESSTARASTVVTCSTLDRWLPPSRTPSFEPISNLVTAPPSWSFAKPVSPDTSPLSPPSVPRPSSNGSLDENLKTLLQRALARRVVLGQPSDTLDTHCRALLEEIGHWLLPLSSAHAMREDNSYRDHLLTLLAHTSKQMVKEMPADESEWLKLLNQWIRIHSHEDVLSHRDIYRLLAVDGFMGFRPKDLKLYLTANLKPLRREFREHAQGVRAMYEWFEERADLVSLTGTDSACVVFLALLQFFKAHLQHELIDDQIGLTVGQAKAYAEGFLYKHSMYYRDIKNVTETVLDELGRVYSDQWTHQDTWIIVGRELLKALGKDTTTLQQVKKKHKV